MAAAACGCGVNDLAKAASGRRKGGRREVERGKEEVRQNLELLSSVDGQTGAGAGGRVRGALSLSLSSPFVTRLGRPFYRSPASRPSLCPPASTSVKFGVSAFVIATAQTDRTVKESQFSQSSDFRSSGERVMHRCVRGGDLISASDSCFEVSPNPTSIR